MRYSKGQNLVELEGIEPPIIPCKGIVIPLNYNPVKSCPEYDGGTL